MDTSLEQPEIIRQQDELLFSKILFERPISRLQARKIGFLAGKHARLKKINDAYQIITALSHDVLVVAEEELKALNLPANLYLTGGKKTSDPYSNTDEALEILSNCSLVVVGMDLEIGSRLQIFLEKLISTRRAPCIFTNESIDLFKTSPGLARDRNGDIYICNTQSLISLAKYLEIDIQFRPSAGIFNKLGLLQVLARDLHAHIVCLEGYQILYTGHSNLLKSGIVNLKKSPTNLVEFCFIPIFVSLLCDVADPERDMLERTLTAGYLLRRGQQGSGEFVDNLRKILQ